MSKNSLSDFLREKAKKKKAKVLLPEGDDIRIRQAAQKIIDLEICKPLVITNSEIDGIETINPNDKALKEKAAKIYSDIKNIPLENALPLMDNIVNFSASLLYGGFADAMVCGATYPTAEVLKPVLNLRKLYPGISPVTSCFFIELKDGKVLIFSDCAMNPEPSSAMLSQIANSAAKAAREILGIEPIVAMLSFSTKGSADSPSVQKVREAVEIAKKKFPSLIIDGEMQADAALVEWIGAKKAPNSPVAGKANVLIFPDLNSGNIAYKLVERLCGAKAIGPVILGLNPPVNDLSRGCSVDDIVDICAIASIQANKNFNS